MPDDAIEKLSSPPEQPSQDQSLQSLNPPRSRFLAGWISGAALVLFACSSARHLLFQSTPFDLGIYDQAIYLISQGQPPISSFLNIHILGDHVSWVFYLIAPLYKLYPSVYWLFALQAISLALGALPTWLLARQAGLSRLLAEAMAGVYLLYPLVFSLNLFDFHPEVMALPAILAAIWAARAGKIAWFCVAIVFILGCKDVLSLTVAAIGLWLLLFEKRRFCGLFALIIGVSWFLIATQWIIPTLKGGEAFGVSRYAYLGDSVLGIAQNLFLRPEIVLSKIFSQATLAYLALLVSPLVWGLSLRHLAPLVGAVPTLLLNVLSEDQGQRQLHNQYSLPVLPFLIVAVIATLAAHQGWLRQKRWILLWSLVAFMVLAKYGRFTSTYLKGLDTWDASRHAIHAIAKADAKTDAPGGVLTNTYLSPHLSHRPIIHLAYSETWLANIAKYDYILLNLRRIRKQERQISLAVMDYVKKSPEFRLSYERRRVYLFTRRTGTE
jgi:uncharacterized membrane protein